MPTLAFRFFNVFGPLQPAGHSYAAVKVDCFECHATQPAKAMSFFHPLVHPSGATADLSRQVRQLAGPAAKQP